MFNKKGVENVQGNMGQDETGGKMKLLFKINK